MLDCPTMTELPDTHPNTPTDADRPERRVALPLEEAARRFGVAPDTLSKRLRAKLAPGFKLRGKWHMWEGDVPPESDVILVSEHTERQPNEPTEPSPTPSEPSETPPEAPGSSPPADHAELIAQLRSENEHLRKLNIGFQEAEREMRQLLAAYASGMAKPPIEALVAGAPEAAGSDSSDVSVQPDPPEPPTSPVATERAEAPEPTSPSRSWWERAWDALRGVNL